jgi:hypothetical protein
LEFVGSLEMVKKIARLKMCYYFKRICSRKGKKSRKDEKLNVVLLLEFHWDGA